MWPSNLTGVLLVAGLVTVLWEMARCAKYGWSGLVNLRTLGVLSFWVGYHFSPMMSYISDELWDHYLLVPEWIDEGMVFSLLCMWCYILGYGIGGRGHRGVRSDRAPRIVLPNVGIGWLYLLILLSAAAFVVMVGGFSEVWSASYGRGAGQFEERDAPGRLKQMAMVAGAVLFIITAMMGSAAVLRRGKGMELKIAGWVAIGTASLKGLHDFSRGAGYPLLILALLALLSRGKKGVPLMVGCALGAVALGTVGYYERGVGNPGIGNYASAAFAPRSWSARDQSKILKFTVDNPLDAMAPWTRKVWTRETETADQTVLVANWLLSLNPLPSEILPLPGVGVNLAVVMGTVGSVGLPTPAFGEIYYVFGRWGALLMMPFGVLLAFFGRLPNRSSDGIGLACWGLAAMCFALGLHNGGRAMTRPLLYGVLLHGIAAWHQRYSRRRAEACMCASSIREMSW